jgi:hypothetical protein
VGIFIARLFANTSHFAPSRAMLRHRILRQEEVHHGNRAWGKISRCGSLDHLLDERNFHMKSFTSCQFAVITSLAFVFALPSASRALPIVFSVGGNANPASIQTSVHADRQRWLQHELRCV